MKSQNIHPPIEWRQFDGLKHRVIDWIIILLGMAACYAICSINISDRYMSLAWSLVSFNVGVEIGQLIIVVVAATLLALAVRARPALTAPLARWGSVGVILAGTYWFVERLFGTGGGA